MTVAALPAIVEYYEDGVTSAFAVPYRFRAASDLIVERVAGGVVQLLTLGIDYSVTGGETDAGGTLTRAAASVGAVLRIRRATARAQPMVYATGDRFPAESHEEALDRTVLIAQEQDAEIGDTRDRALLVPPGEVALDLPGAAVRAGAFLAFDPTGNAIPASGTGADAGLRTDLANPDAGARLAAFGQFPALHIDTVEQALRDGKGVSARRFGLYVGEDATTGQVSANTVRLIDGLDVIQDFMNPILPEIGAPAPIPVFAVPQIIVPPGVTCVEPDAIEIADKMGVVFVGQGSRMHTNANKGACTLLFKGASDGFGMRALEGGSRNLGFEDVSVCYDSPTFTGDLVDSYSSPGTWGRRAYFGSFGVSGGTRLQTARSLHRLTYDEFFYLEHCVLDGAQKGIWCDDERGANTFGGALIYVTRCTFYDFGHSMVHVPGNRTRDGLLLLGNDFNPISVSPQRCVDVTNVEGFMLQACKFAGSVANHALVEWLRALNVTGSIVANSFNDLTRAATIGMFGNIVGNRVFSTEGFALKYGAIKTGGNEFSKCNIAWLIDPIDYLALDMTPDRFKSAVTTSYYAPTASALTKGTIRYDVAQDQSTSKFEVNAPNVRIFDESAERVSTNGDATISRFLTGKLISCVAASGTQVLTLDAPTPGTHFVIEKLGGATVEIMAPAGKNFLTGEAFAPTKLTLPAAAVGARVMIESRTNLGWQVRERSAGVVSS